tara:strand:+ start:64 stop:369 length:306 start_codon:yes stop_codon:yes gene_type:complete
MMILSICIVSGLLVTAIGFIINLMRKLENAEDYLIELEESNSRYKSFFESIRKKSNNNYSYMRQLDRLGSFEADDETGVIFNTLKDIVEELNKEFNGTEED